MLGGDVALARAFELSEELHREGINPRFPRYAIDRDPLQQVDGHVDEEQSSTLWGDYNHQRLLLVPDHAARRSARGPS